MTKEQHAKEVEKLRVIEEELSKIILDTNIKFIAWQDQRNVCNKGLKNLTE